MEAKLVDEERSDVSGFDIVGEMCVRGPLIIPGYFNAGGSDGGVNRKDWDDEGFYHSGDVMFCNQKTGKWYIVDRKKELIKVRAYQVAPPELEGVILDMNGVVDAAVIGVKDTDGEGEVPRAYVIRRPGHAPKVTEDEVKSWVRQRLASFKRLDGGVRFVDSIPKTAGGYCETRRRQRTDPLLRSCSCRTPRGKVWICACAEAVEIEALHPRPFTVAHIFVQLHFDVMLKGLGT